MMSSGCIGGCLDVTEPVKAMSFRKVCRWAEADAEFLIRVVSSINYGSEEPPALDIARTTKKKKSNVPYKPESHREYIACRERYLRSYTFSTRKETVAQRTKNWLLEIKKKNKTGLMKPAAASSSWPLVINGVLGFLFMCVAKVDVHHEQDKAPALTASVA